MLEFAKAKQHLSILSATCHVEFRQNDDSQEQLPNPNPMFCSVKEVLRVSCSLLNRLILSLK
eukprot:scaffold1986_cov129-Ochromonas_danica.AAC.1